MQIVCISRGSLSKGGELGERLAHKLGWQCISREQMVEEAIKRGISVGKLETAILKPHIFTERLALEKDHYQAFSTMYLLERMARENTVYHGRAGHLLLPGLDHMLRIRVVADRESRIKSVMQRLNLTREKSRVYVDQVDEDRKRWVKLYFGLDWDDPTSYDLIINLEQMNVDNAATALCSMTQLPDFLPTPSTQRAMQNMLLAARARVALAEHEKTYAGQFIVRADRGVVSVVYKLQQADLAEQVTRVLRGLSGVEQVVCTMARSNILWVQERFDPESDAFKEVVSLARKWDAAVELLRLDPADDDEAETRVIPAAPGIKAHPDVVNRMKPMSRTIMSVHGGIEDDSEEGQDAGADDGGLHKTLAELARIDRSGGGRTVRATGRRLAESVDTRIEYNLLVVGDVFLKKGHAAQTRMANELCGALREKLKAPVVNVEELKQQYLFSPRQFLNLFGFLAASAAFYLAV